VWSSSGWPFGRLGEHHAILKAGLESNDGGDVRDLV
jgi:hypothetical protein